MEAPVEAREQLPSCLCLPKLCNNLIIRECKGGSRTRRYGVLGMWCDEFFFGRNWLVRETYVHVVTLSILVSSWVMTADNDVCLPDIGTNKQRCNPYCTAFMKSYLPRSLVTTIADYRFCFHFPNMVMDYCGISSCLSVWLIVHLNPAIWSWSKVLCTLDLLIEMQCNVFTSWLTVNDLCGLAYGSYLICRKMCVNCHRFTCRHNSDRSNGELLSTANMNVFSMV